MLDRDGHVLQVDMIGIAALQGLTPLQPTAEIALGTMLLSEGIFLSGRLGREVSREEIEEMSVSTALREQETPFGTLRYKNWPFEG